MTIFDIVLLKAYSFSKHFGTIFLNQTKIELINKLSTKCSLFVYLECEIPKYLYHKNITLKFTGSSNTVRISIVIASFN